MKKIILIFVAALASITGAKADGYAISGEGTAAKGGAGIIAINLENPEGVRAVQFTLTLPSTLTYNNSIEKTARTDAFSVQYDQTLNQVTITTTDDDATISAGSGTIAYINVTAGSEATTELSVVTLSDGIVSFTGTSQQSLSDVSFNVTINDGYVLDENSTILPAATTGNVDVTVRRTLKAGVWNTLCLPFAMTTTKIGSIFGEKATVCELSKCTTSGNSIAVQFTTSNVILANTPYIIKIDKEQDITEFQVEDVKINPNENSTITELKRTNLETLENEVHAKFIGTLHAGNTIPADYIFLGAGDNKFYYSDGSNEIKGFRGYFWLKDFSSSTPGGARQLKLMVDGDEATGIEGLYINGAPVVEGVYNLKGQRIEAPAQKGVYIKDGKKVVIK